MMIETRQIEATILLFFIPICTSKRLTMEKKIKHKILSLLPKTIGETD